MTQISNALLIAMLFSTVAVKGDVCNPSPCKNGATCYIGADGSAVCACTDLYVGDLCDEKYTLPPTTTSPSQNPTNSLKSAYIPADDSMGESMGSGKASCCTNWNEDCYDIASPQNFNRACIERADCGDSCLLGSWHHSECQQCCMHYEGHQMSWNCEEVYTSRSKFKARTQLKDAIDTWFFDSVNAIQSFGHISDWDTSSVKDMRGLFSDAVDFNEDISKWNTINVRDMSSMFSHASSFNADISGWDTTNVKTMSRMFANATDFNQDISGWNMINVTDMSKMLSGASSFNHDVFEWITPLVTNIDEQYCWEMFERTHCVDDYCKFRPCADAADCCSTWSDGCYSTPSPSNNYHACNMCFGAPCSSSCNFNHESEECKECCRFTVAHETPWNCQAPTLTDEPITQPEEIADAADCCSTWSDGCYFTPSSSNNYHACLGSPCSSSCDLGQISFDEECKECCRFPDAPQTPWNCPIPIQTDEPITQPEECNWYTTSKQCNAASSCMWAPSPEGDACVESTGAGRRHLSSGLRRLLKVVA